MTGPRPCSSGTALSAVHCPGLLNRPAGLGAWRPQRCSCIAFLLVPSSRRPGVTSQRSRFGLDARIYLFLGDLIT